MTANRKLKLCRGVTSTYTVPSSSVLVSVMGRCPCCETPRGWCPISRVFGGSGDFDVSFLEKELGAHDSKRPWCLPLATECPSRRAKKSLLAKDTKNGAPGDHPAAARSTVRTTHFPQVTPKVQFWVLSPIFDKIPAARGESCANIPAH